MVDVKWVPPMTLPPAFTKSRIFRSTQENGQYQVIAEIDTIVNGVPVTKFSDVNGSRDNNFYLVRFFDPTGNVEFEDFVLGFFFPTPREKRLRNWIVDFLPSVIKDEVSDENIGQALRYSVNTYNLIPAFTNFTIETLPELDEPFVTLGAQVWLIYLKYLRLGIRDFAYSDMGLSLTIDRGPKMKAAIDDLNKMYFEIVRPAKWRYTPQGLGLGTVPIPVSLGGNLNRGLLNILDVVSVFGR